MDDRWADVQDKSESITIQQIVEQLVEQLAELLTDFRALESRLYSLEEMVWDRNSDD